MSGVNKNIGIYGGTFDPVHEGHLKVVQSVLSKLKLDVLYVVAARNPWMKKGKKITPYTHRLNMLGLVFEQEKKTKILAEGKERENSYSIDTVVDVEKTHPGANVFLIVGEDVVCDFEKWEKAKILLNKVTLVCVKREGRSSVELDKKIKQTNRNAKVVFLEKVNDVVSSSAYREKGATRFMNKDVLKYIKTHRLYEYER